jgi:electron transport complex protein RnfE
VSEARPPSLYAEFAKGVWKENPAFVQVLGMCPTLAVTTTAVNALAMGGATTFVLTGSAFFVSMFRRLIPHEVRISTYIIIIASFVTIADSLLEAFTPHVHKELGPFIALIVANCVVLGRQESFAAKRPILPSVADAFGTGVGFTIALSCVGGLREIFGLGSYFGVDLFGERFEPWVVMILPPGGFLAFGLLMILLATAKRRKSARLAEGVAA